MRWKVQTAVTKLKGGRGQGQVGNLRVRQLNTSGKILNEQQ